MDRILKVDLEKVLELDLKGLKHVLTKLGVETGDIASMEEAINTLKKQQV